MNENTISFGISSAILSAAQTKFNLHSIEMRASRKSSMIHSSSIGGCARLTYYKATETPTDNQMDFVSPREDYQAKTKSTFSLFNGTLVHEYLEDAIYEHLRDTEVKIVAGEVKLTTPWLTGTFDLLLQLPGGSMALCDLKTINSGAYRKLQEAKDAHYDQVNSYLAMLHSGEAAMSMKGDAYLSSAYQGEPENIPIEDIIWGTVIYINKDPWMVREAPVKAFTWRFDEELMHYYRDRASWITASIQEGRLPRAEPDLSPCHFCDWRLRCKAEGRGKGLLAPPVDIEQAVRDMTLQRAIRKNLQNYEPGALTGI